MESNWVLIKWFLCVCLHAAVKIDYWRFCCIDEHLIYRIVDCFLPRSLNESQKWIFFEGKSKKTASALFYFLHTSERMKWSIEVIRGSFNSFAKSIFLKLSWPEAFTYLKGIQIGQMSCIRKYDSIPSVHLCISQLKYCYLFLSGLYWGFRFDNFSPNAREILVS